MIRPICLFPSHDLGPDSIRYGIQWLQKHNIVIHTSCVKFRQEIEQYQWKKDKWGESMAIPVDKNNHGIDALRYAYSHDALGAHHGIYV